MNTRNVTFSSAGAVLHGTLLAPPRDGPFMAALIVAGSGPMDHDGNTKRLAPGVSRDLADLFHSSGWVSFRFDKRGVGASEGEHLTTGLYDELADVEAACAWLADQSEVAGLVAFGHSLGATMAVELVGRHPELLDAVVLAFTAKTGEETLTWQTQQVKDHLLPAPVRGLLWVLRTDVVRQQQKAVARLKDTTGDVERIQLAKVNAKWMREFLEYDPLPALERVTQPVLAITGSKDVQVDPADLDTVAAVVPLAETQEIADVDHILRHEPAAVSNPRFYKRQVGKPIDGRVTAAVTRWLDGRTG